MSQHSRQQREQAQGETEMFQSVSQVMGGRFVVLRDGRVSGYMQPEPEFMRRRYEQAQALRELQRESRVKAEVSGESQGFVERIRIALGIA
jgi:hypothetical protein